MDNIPTPPEYARTNRTNATPLAEYAAQWLKVVSTNRPIKARHFRAKISSKPISKGAKSKPFPRYCGCASCRGVCRCPLHVTPRSLGYWKVDIYMDDDRTISHMLTDVHIVDYSDRSKFKPLVAAFARHHGRANVVLELILVDGATSK